MLRSLIPPQHRVDHVGQLIVDFDSSLDKERLARELAEMEAACLTGEAEQGDVFDRAGFRVEDHPLTRYWSGESRYDLQAQGYLMGQPVAVRSYFNQGEPTIFSLKRLSWQRYNTLLAIEDGREQLFAFAREGVAAIKGPDIDVTFDGKGVTDAWMQSLFETHHNLPLVLGTAVVVFNRSLAESEKKGADNIRAPLRV